MDKNNDGNIIFIDYNFNKVWDDLEILESIPMLDPEMVYNNLLCNLRNRPKEEVWLLALDSGNRFKNKVVFEIGGFNNISIWAGNLLEKALSMKAAAIILAHNHPGGKAIPSTADISATNKLRDVCDILSIPLLDHIIVGINGFYSFRNNGSL